MKIFNLMQNKRKVKDGTTNPNPDFMSYDNKTNHPCNEEFSDWPNGLLSIGTFGSNNLRRSENFTALEHTRTKEFEEVDQQSRLILNKHISLGSSSLFQGEPEKRNLSVEKLIDACLRDEDEKKTDDEPGGVDIRSDKRRSGISKKSLSFLIKKVLLCRGGFVPAPIVKDSVLNPKLDNSRMEKILRAMLHKKIYPQKHSPKNSRRTYLDMPANESDSDKEEEATHKSKWVKTDSEYIVLEI